MLGRGCEPIRFLLWLLKLATEYGNPLGITIPDNIISYRSPDKGSELNATFKMIMQSNAVTIRTFRLVLHTHTLWYSKNNHFMHTLNAQLMTWKIWTSTFSMINFVFGIFFKNSAISSLTKHKCLTLILKTGGKL